MDKKFELRFDTHMVLKKEDIYQCLNTLEQEVLQMLSEKVVGYRNASGRTPNPCYLVVNVDEPYADLVLEAIKYGETHYFPIKRDAPCRSDEAENV